MGKIFRTFDTVEDFFLNGVKRMPGWLRTPPDGAVLNLGSGYSEFHPVHVADANLDRPDWDAPILPYPRRSVSVIHMYHFLEHLDVDTALEMLKQVEMTLVDGGVCNIVVPHAMCPLAYQAPDHRSYWTEEGFQDTFYSQGYDSAYGHEWDMDIGYMSIMGVKWSNLCVFVQLVKRVNHKPIETPWRRS